MIVRAYPKINLALDVLKKTQSGFHEIQTVFHQLSGSFDEIEVEVTGGGGIEIISDDPRLPLDENNTVFKAVQKLLRAAKKDCGVRIFIKKKIPLSAGLGGGSSNAVAALKALGKMLNTPSKMLRDIGDEIGMDCAFFFLGNNAPGATALGTHFGEKITPLDPLPPGLTCEVIETGVEISTKWAYENIDLKSCGKNPDKTKKLIAALKRKDPVGILQNLHNDFEELIFSRYPRLFKKKREIESSKPGKVLLCGSGGALVRIYS